MTKITIEFYDYVFICNGEIIEQDFFDVKDGDEIARRHANQLTNTTKPILGVNADYWSLLALCSVEASGAQSRADVAQSVYNRLAMSGMAVNYGKTIKEIIIMKDQYEPTFKNINDWNVINDEVTAIKAVANSKGWTTVLAKTAIKNTSIAINSKFYQDDSMKTIGTRTSFRATKRGVDESIPTEEQVERTPIEDNNVFFWAEGGKQMKGKPVPKPFDFVKANVNINVS